MSTGRDSQITNGAQSAARFHHVFGWQARFNYAEEIHGLVVKEYWRHAAT
jgi:hypothetical protein